MDQPARDVVDRLHAALDDVVHVLVLDPGDRVVLVDDGAPDDVVVAARAVATTLMLVDGTGEGAVRAVVETPGATVYATLAPGGAAFVLLGPPGWNVVLARRSVDPVVADLLAEGAVERLRDVRRAGVPPIPLSGPPGDDPRLAPSADARRSGTLAQAARAEAVRRRARPV